jgi:predicted kinase
MPASLPAKPPLLVIVTGLPATGKTSIARRLAQDLRLPLLSKDDIKESLFDNLGWSDREWSMKLGRASILLLYQLVERLLAAGVSAITETAFHPEWARDEFLAIQKRAPFRPYVIECVMCG